MEREDGRPPQVVEVRPSLALIVLKLTNNKLNRKRRGRDFKREYFFSLQSLGVCEADVREKDWFFSVGGWAPLLDIYACVYVCVCAYVPIYVFVYPVSYCLHWKLLMIN